MRKSPDITKYEPEWQMVRVKVKGHQTALEDKLRIVKQYFDRNKTVDAWERVVNWLQGLQMGYRSSGDTAALERIALALTEYNGQQTITKEYPQDKATTFKKLQMYPYTERLQLWKDLFDRNKKWLAKGYNHQEHNDFMDLLWQTFVTNHEAVPESIDKVKMDALRKQSRTIKNTHKFLY